ncbi:hypothetical protein GC163_13080 [bacterium]|nr:hypothetical protein [bacterium]
MSQRFIIGMLLVLCTTGPWCQAEEPYQDFVRGLRERQYFDMALFYLDQLALRKDVPQEIRQLIPYEKAATLLDSSRVSRSPERQVEQLDQALAFLEQFVKESPNHPQAGDANTERAQILIGKARVEILQSKSPANQGAKLEYQQRAQKLIQQARDVFQKAFDQHEANWKSFGTYINKETEQDKYEARALAEVNMIRAQLDLALCTYEEAQTYDVGSVEYKKLLNDAAAKFEEMHQRYRSQVGGLYGRLWQGKCFEEMGDLQKALGIYNELLGHPGNDGAIKRLKDQTLQFKLISLNSDQRNDYQLVVDLGEEWLKENKADSRTSIGLGIRWQVARAYEMLGDNRELSKSDAERFWRSARDQATQVNRFPGEYKDVSLALMQRLDVKIGGKERTPDTFDAAFGLGQQQITAITQLKDQIAGAKKAKQPPEEIKKLQQDLDFLLADTAKTFDLALRLATPQDDAKSVTKARYMYSYVNFMMRRNYEAAILAEYVAKTVDKEDETTGMEAAYLSMAAYVQAFNDAKGSTEDKNTDLAFIIKACNLLADRWPDSDQANDARMTLGRIYSQIKRPVDAAAWYGKVPESDAKYSEAQLAAGQAFWTAYLTSGSFSDDDADKPTTQQLTEWRQQAETLLRNGIARLSATAPKEGAAPPELIAAKMSLAQILISLGKDGDAIKLLLDEPQSVIKAITVADETKRPAQGVQGRQFAVETYKLLLRAYIGNGKLNEARDTMKTLEKVAGAEGGADVTDLYVGLGKLLREELDRFREAGETDRFNSLMTSFETFLNDLYQRKEGQTFGSLSWIGETYFALGEAASNDPSRSTSSFEKAGNAFQEILNRAASQPDFVPADQVSAVKVRLIRCYRLKKEFETGEKLLGEVLAEREKDLRAQTEGAFLYQSWGTNGDPDKLMVAINGNPTLKLWGWRNLGNRLQNSIDQGRKDFMPMFVEARVNGTECRRQYGLAQTSIQKRTEELEKCEIELVTTVSVTKDLTDDQMGEFNKLYRDVLRDSGKPPEDLQPTEEFASTPIVATSPEPSETKQVKAEPPPPPAAPINDNTAWIMFGVTVLVGAGIVAWLLLSKGKKKPSGRKSVGRSEPQMAFSGIAAAPVPASGPPPAPRAKPRPASAGTATKTRPASSSGGTTATAKSGEKPAAKAGEKPVAKPRPKPPTPPQ